MLRPAERRTLQALGDTLFPSLAEGDPRGGEVIPNGLEAALGRMAPETARELRLAIALFELGAVVRHGCRFSRLEPEPRARYVERWMRSRLAFRRTVYKALRDLLGHVYYQDPRTWPSIGYAGPPVGLREAE